MLQALRQQRADLAPASDRELIERCVERVVLHPTTIEITLRTDPSASDQDQVDAADAGPDAAAVAAAPVLRIPWSRAATKRRREIIAPEEPEHSDHRPIRAETRATLVRAMALGRRWLDELVSKAISTPLAIAQREGCSQRHVERTISGVPGTRSGPGCGRRSAAPRGRCLAADRSAARMVVAMADARSAPIGAELVRTSLPQSRCTGVKAAHPRRPQRGTQHGATNRNAEGRRLERQMPTQRPRTGRGDGNSVASPPVTNGNHGIIRAGQLGREKRRLLGGGGSYLRTPLWPESLLSWAEQGI
jgi:hypothetical protein